MFARIELVVVGALVFAALSAAFLGAAAPAHGDAPLSPPCAVTVIPAGTIVEDADRSRWNRVVLLATPQFASGDTGAVSDGIRENVTSFTFAILATVRAVEDGEDEEPVHEIVEIGVGYAADVDDRLTVVAPDARLSGFTLDFLGRQILGAKHRSLADIVLVGTQKTAHAFDVPTLMLRDTEHREMTVRHVVRIDPRTGECTTCVWLASADADGTKAPSADPPRLVRGGTRETRDIHVDGSRFVFGFPAKQAFAVKDLPPGRSIPWSESLLAAAAAAHYDVPQLQQLTQAIDDAATRSADRSARDTRPTRAE